MLEVESVHLGLSWKSWISETFLSKPLCALVPECQTNCIDDKTANKQLENFGATNGNVCLL